MCGEFWRSTVRASRTLCAGKWPFRHGTRTRGNSQAKQILRARSAAKWQAIGACRRRTTWWGALKIREVIVRKFVRSFGDVDAAGSRILVVGEVTDTWVAAAVDWLNRAASWSPVTQMMPAPGGPFGVEACPVRRTRHYSVPRLRLLHMRSPTKIANEAKLLPAQQCSNGGRLIGGLSAGLPLRLSRITMRRASYTPSARPGLDPSRLAGS
jgi:hypothetical protein